MQFLDVDSAIAIPVNIAALTDDTDFITPETGIAYNASGMALVWNFTTSAGVFTQTAVTPTTSGVHDWTHEGKAIYTLEIPASGGTINNDTEGYGYFSGTITGVLPFTGPTYGFRAAALNDQLVDSTDSDDYPATRGQIGSLSTGSSAISIQSESYVLTTGTESANSYTDTATVDNVRHQHTDDGGALDLYYQFDVGGSGVATDVMITGRINGGNDDLDGVYAYNWSGASWDRLGDFNGQNSSLDQSRDYNLLVRHTGTGANLGKVRIRFYAASGLTSSTLHIDQILSEYTVVSQSVGYANGSIWVDTNGSNTNTEAYVDGTADNPVSTWASALTLSSSLGMQRFQIINGSSITLSGNSDEYTIMGSRYTLDLNGQSCSSIFVMGATMTGTCTGASAPHFEHCEIGDVTLPPCRINGGSGLYGTLTIGSAGDFDIVQCNSLFSGGGAPTIDLGGAVGATDIHMRSWHGPVTFSNVLAGDTISLEGAGGCVTVNGTGGEVSIRGIFEEVVDNSSAAVDLTEIATINRKSLISYEEGAVWVDTNGSNTGVLPYVDGTADNPVNSLNNAETIVSLVDLKRIHLLKGSSITLGQAFTRYIFGGEGGIIALGSQAINFCTFVGQTISGIQTGTGRNFFADSRLNSVTITDSALRQCSLNGTITLSDTGDYSMTDCYATKDSDEPVFDFTAAGNTELLLRDWHGPMTVKNMSAGDVVALDGNCSNFTIDATCTGGAITFSGNVAFTDNAGGAIVPSEDANLNTPPTVTEITADIDANSTQLAAILVDTGTDIPALIAALNDISTAQVNAEVVDVMETDTHTELTTVPGATTSYKKMLQWVFALGRNKITQTASTATLRNDDDNGSIATSTDSDDGTTATRGEWTP